MTTKRAIEIAIREITDQLFCEDISADTRKQLEQAKNKLQKFVAFIYEESQ